MTEFARRIASDTYERTLESIAPNAARLKRSSNSTLGRALLLATNLFLAVIGVAWLLAYSAATATPVVEPRGIIEMLPPVVLIDPPLEAPEPDTGGGARISPEGAAGTPTPVPDETVPDDATVADNADQPLAGIGPVGDTPSAGDGTTDGSASSARRRAIDPPRPAGPTSQPPVREDAPITEAPDVEKVFEFVEIDPTLIGGLEALQAGIEYPAFERQIGTDGQVIVQFVVDETGRTSDIVVARSISPGLDRAAVEAVRRARFTPGQQNGRSVRVRMTLPVTFRLR